MGWDIGNQIIIIIDEPAKANDLKGVIDVADFADDDKLGKGKEMVDRHFIFTIICAPLFKKVPEKGILKHQVLVNGTSGI